MHLPSDDFKCGEAVSRVSCNKMTAGMVGILKGWQDVIVYEVGTELGAYHFLKNFGEGRDALILDGSWDGSYQD